MPDRSPPSLVARVRQIRERAGHADSLRRGWVKAVNEGDQNAAYRMRRDYSDAKESLVDLFAAMERDGTAEELAQLLALSETAEVIVSIRQGLPARPARGGARR